MTKSGRSNLLKPRHAEASRVDFVELFFDLVFVFAVTQLSHRLIEHPDARGAIETAILFVAIWWAWISTTWVTNWLDPRRAPVRLLLFALMGLGLFLSMSIPQAFGGRGLVFAGAYVAFELGRSLFTLLALRGHDASNYRNFQRIIVWQLGSAALWIAGGLAEPDARILLWASGLALWSLGPVVGFLVPGLGRSETTDWRVDPHHLAERCGLFIILSLGESVLVLGATVAELEWDGPTLAAFAAALLGTIAMWWTYFNIGAVRAADRFEKSDDPGRVARLAYTYLHLPIVAGIVIWAAAVEWVLAHPRGHVDLHAALATLGGPAIYLAGEGVFKRVTGARWWPLSHLVGLGVLAALGVGQLWLEPWHVVIGAAATLVMVAIWETRSLRAWRRAADDDVEID